jgi:osmotically inducible protein OsmC
MTASTATAGTTSTATATWEGGLRNGKGQFTAKSGSFQGSYSFPTRFEGAKGTNPEELIAAAHASCVSMALSGELEKAGTPATRITTTASATIGKVANGFRITRMRLEVRGEVPGVDQAAFAKAAEAAKEGCPVSQALKGNVSVELDARLA